MDSVCTRRLISKSSYGYPIIHPLVHTHHFPRSRFVPYSKKSNFQDFQGYAKPNRLLRAGEVELCTDSSVEKIATSFKVGRSEYLYKVKLETSNLYGSGLSDMNAGILLCLIDENGNSILQRIPTSLSKDHPNKQKTYDDFTDIMHFQRGSVDEFTFSGPELGILQAIWISLESGQWRLGGMSVNVISQSEYSLQEKYKKENIYNGVEYKFIMDDVLLGEGSEISMIELRPSKINEFSADKSTLLENILDSSPVKNLDISNQESMKEYSDLKSSLLLYDAILILFGSTIASFAAGESSGFAFFTGGFSGFFYLLLLQRSVDELPAAGVDRSETKEGLFKRFRWSTSALVLTVVCTFLGFKFGFGDADVALAPKDVVFGMMGFLACKVAVVLAAFKPMHVQLKENK